MLTTRPSAELRSQVARYLLAGCLNTVVGVALLLTLNRVVTFTSAYTIAFSMGVIGSCFLNYTYVFERTGKRRRIPLFIVGYLIVYVIGRFVLQSLTLWWNPDDVGAAVVLVAITAPLSFIVARWTLSGARRRAELPTPSR